MQIMKYSRHTGGGEERTSDEHTLLLSVRVIQDVKVKNILFTKLRIQKYS
jgi:hypothetical protein